MRLIIAFLVAAATLVTANAAQNPKYKLYYLDKTRNVCVVGIGSDGTPVTHFQKLTSGGGYDGYSVSPNNTQVFGWKQIGIWPEGYSVCKCFLEKNGKLSGRIAGKLLTDGKPWADWSPKNKYLIVKVPQEVTTQTIIYSLEKRKIICDTMDLLPDFCEDQDYSFVLQDRGDSDNSSAKLSILDMKTGKFVNLGQVTFGMSGGPSQSVWFGKSHRFAFIDYNGNLNAGEVYRSKSLPFTKKWMLAKNGKCSDLRYIHGKGIYFKQKTRRTTTAYCSNDLRTLSKTTLLPAHRYETPFEPPIEENKVYSPDRLLCASLVGVKPGGTETIRIRNSKGQFVRVAIGTSPKWKGSIRNRF
jgi:hypothetical protein